MTLYETINLIKNYDEQVKNYLLYMNRINNILLNNISYISEIKVQMKIDIRLKKRLIYLGNTINGSVIQKIFPELFDVENKKIR